MRRPANKPRAARRRAEVEEAHVDAARADAALHGELAMRRLDQRTGPRDDALDAEPVERDGARRWPVTSRPLRNTVTSTFGFCAARSACAERVDERAVDAEQDVAGAEELRGGRVRHHRRDGQHLALRADCALRTAAPIPRADRPCARSRAASAPTRPRSSAAARLRAQRVDHVDDDVGWNAEVDLREVAARSDTRSWPTCRARALADRRACRRSPTGR